MRGKIILVAHRPSGLKATAPVVVLEVGEPLPAFYEAGRRAGLQVLRIDGDDPIVCTLSDGDQILIKRQSVSAITWDV